MDVTQSFAATFVDELAVQGVDFACISPGSRSAPLAIALQPIIVAEAGYDRADAFPNRVVVVRYP